MFDDEDLKDEPTQSALGAARHRAVYWLPNLFTLGGLFAGFYSIIAAIHDRFPQAAVAIGIAMLLDGTDGRIARWTNTTSDFGKELDSLCDVVSFGVAPAIVVYQWGFERISGYGWLWERFGWACAFLYAAAAALRLARFNVRIEVQDKRWFQGLPSPAAAGLVASSVLCGTIYGPQFELHGSDLSIPAFAMTMFAGVCMVSNFGYYSFKDLDPRQPIRFRYLIMIPTVLMLIAIEPPLFLFLLFFAFAASGPALALWRWRRRQARPAPR
jgi:CDP-diacylglycerol--serine O-phosphatidyltransferase